MQYRIVTDFQRPPLSSNEQKRAHYHKVAKCKKLVGEQIKERAEKIPRLGPVTVEVIWFVKDKRKRDTDGLGPFLKAACDGLVQAGVLEDDHSDFVVKTSMSIDKTDMGNPRIEVVITEVS